jgi:sugar phosphate isomerase/epimerase
MKFAFSTVSCPVWEFQTIVLRAKEYGYDGVELRGFLNEAAPVAADVFLVEPVKIKRLFQSGGVEIACLASSIAMTGKKRQDKQLTEDAKRYIDTAAELGCPLVKVFDTNARPGHTRESAGLALGEFLMPIGDYAAERDVCIVVENSLSFRAAKELWMILDRLSHPAISACWDVFNAALIGESPSISVPTLNSKIQYVQVKDATLGALGATYCQLGDGDVPVKKFISRLMGIGYDGYVTMEWEKAWLPNLAEPEAILPEAVKRLKEWSKPMHEEAEADSEPAAAH